MTRTVVPCHLTWPVLLALAAVVVTTHGHGRVERPASRASAWRAGFNTRPNYNDNGVNCGGFQGHWQNNLGKCGICGDPYDTPTPRAHELGGVYGGNVIVAEYTSGETINVTVVITAYHHGFWEFKVCPDPGRNDQECFEQYVLRLEDGNTEYYPEKCATYDLKYRLPEGLVCEHCVVQWKYTAGNNWGVCPNGTQRLGCGNQEEFRACSDIRIRASPRSRL